MAAQTMRTGGRRRLAVRGALAALHLAGFVASSRLVEQWTRRLPGFETSRLAEALARAGEAGAPAADGSGEWAVEWVVEWASLLLREAVLPATWEELLFRGLVYGVLGHVGGPRAAILGSALLFGLAHGDLHHGLAATLLGISLACLRARHGLAAAWLAHAVNNALAFSGPPARALAADGSALGLVLAVALAGISNAILLQALCSGKGDPSRGPSTASGDAGV